MTSKIVELKPVDTKGENIALGIGRHIIGRGPLLGCSDKHISRNHAVIDIKPDGTVSLESTHVNPCFYQKSGREKPVTLFKFTAQELSVGDRFSLLPCNYVYELISNLCEDPTIENEGKTDEKIDDFITSISSKDISSKKNEADVSSAHNPIKEQATPLPQHVRKRVLPSWIKELSTQPNKVENETASVSGKKNEKPKKINTHGESSKEETSKMPKLKEAGSTQKEITINNKLLSNNQNAKRKPCRFGKKCYRKNPIHFQEESHPGDLDYVSPSNSDTETEIANDDRPECEFGLNCYRKNLDHRTKYKHTKTTRPPRTAAKKAKAKNKTLQEDDDDDDDDSFIDDDDSDDYNPASDGDTEEDIDALMVEANEFKRNKKMLKPA